MFGQLSGHQMISDCHTWAGGLVANKLDNDRCATRVMDVTMAIRAEGQRDEGMVACDQAMEGLYMESKMPLHATVRPGTNCLSHG